MKHTLTKDNETIEVKDRYLNKFLSQGWTDTCCVQITQKKISKNTVKAIADVIEASPQEEGEPNNLMPSETKGD